ncbi:MAG: hypothetical protein IJ048_12335 [Clostridia bacterium]|nr:hypothetical protein [Clostridia bacterium]
MLTDRKRAEERTGVQTSMPYGGDFDLQSDFVMVYRLNDTTAERVRQYRERGFVVHLMTGVSWGTYNDYRDGEFDGRDHWDEGQVRMDGEMVQHGSERNPYMIPSVAFADYLSEKLKPAVDAGVEAIHMEEPEIWVFSGYSEWFKREYELYYREPWQPPHESADAYYRANKLKVYLYTRALGRIADAVKEYALRTRGKSIRFYVPTHSLINYTQYGISSPESMLLDLPGIDGYIAQVWSDTSRVPNVYHGEKKQRVFESAMLEYGAMQELTRGTGRTMWLLQDPISDRKCFTWDFYRSCYLEGLTAALLQPEVSQYEICPWPNRVMTGRYPEPDGEPIPASYVTTLLSTTQALRDMDQPYEWLGDEACVGVMVSDTMLYQRTYGYGYDPGIRFAEFGEESNASSFYGLSLPLLHRGIRALPIQMENIRRFPGYLDGQTMIALSYEFMKPESPDIHYALAGWVREGGALALVGDGSDPFGRIRHWWNTGRLRYDTPMQHLTDALGLGREPEEGVHAVGKGFVAILRVHPAQIAYDAETEEHYAALLRECRRRMNRPAFREKNYFALRRGPYVIAAAMADSAATESFSLKGRFVRLDRPELPVVDEIAPKGGEYVLAADLDRYEPAVCLVGSAGRVEDYSLTEGCLTFSVHGPTGARCALRFKGPRPTRVELNGADTPFEYDAFGGTLLIRLAGDPNGARVVVTWPSA